MSSGRWTNRLRVLSNSKPFKVQAQNSQAVYNPLLSVTNCSPDYTPIIYSLPNYCNTPNIPCFSTTPSPPNLFDSVDGGNVNGEANKTLDGKSNNGSKIDGGTIPDISWNGVDGGRANTFNGNALDGKTNSGNGVDGGTIPDVNWNRVNGRTPTSSNPNTFDGNSRNGNTADGGLIPDVTNYNVNGSQPNIFNHNVFDGRRSTSANSGTLDGGFIPG